MNWLFSFVLYMFGLMLCAIAAWLWSGPFVSILLTGIAFACGVMWAQARVEMWSEAMIDLRKCPNCGAVLNVHLLFAGKP